MSLILITGATGEVARGVLPVLARNFRLRLLALEPAAPTWLDRHHEYISADILDWRALEQALAGVDAVLHLAVASGHSGTFEDDSFNDVRFDVNVKGTFHLFEVARRLAVPRVVHVSSVMTTWGHAAQWRDPTARVSGDAPCWPVGTYALTKSLGEAVAHYFARQHPQRADQTIVVVRIAAPFAPEGATCLRPQQIAFPDLAQAFRLALTAPIPEGYQVVTIAGNASASRWDLSKAQQVLGYKPTIEMDALPVKWLEPFAVREI